MARMRTVAERAEQLLGAAVVSTSPVAGGDTCTSTRLRLSDGSSALMKTRAHAPEGFFEAEARGLTWLAEPGVAPVVEVLGVQADCLILSWIEPARPSPEAAAEFGRALAELHVSGAERFGAEHDGFIATLPLPNKPTETWPEFFAVRRILPYLRLCTDRGQIAPADADAVEGVVRRIVDLAGPDEPPSRLHGDLWSGNLVWNAEHHVVLIDPSAYGGHRETDLAMLALFGMPQQARVLAAYEEAYPLAEGWEQRQPLHQLFPLLVHAALMGGRYGALAGDAARKLL
jgi:fructosamine-3-kinase